jgi:hypothetical protein
LLDEEIGRFCVTGEHLVELGLGRLDDRLLEHLADRVDGDVDALVTRLRPVEKLDDLDDRSQVALGGVGIAPRGLDGQDRFIGGGFRGVAAVMDNDGSAKGGQRSTDKPPRFLARPAMMATFRSTADQASCFSRIVQVYACLYHEGGRAVATRAGQRG